jgi:hypothetical protein
LIIVLLMPSGPPTTAAAATAATRPTAEELNPTVDAIDFRDVPLSKAIDTLRAMTGVNIVVRWPALEAAGIDRKQTVDLRVANLPLQRLLELVGEVAAADVPLAARAQRGVVVLTTRDDFADEPMLRIYNVHDLVRSNAALRPPIGGGRASLPATAPARDPLLSYVDSIEQLKLLITEAIDPESWREAGGIVGSIRDFNGQLIIAQTPDAHERIKELLDKLRQR